MEIIVSKKSRIEILHQIISKGGLYGNIANLYLNDSIKSHQFLLECSEQCHHISLIEFFGNELIEDIVTYCESYKGSLSTVI